METGTGWVQEDGCRGMRMGLAQGWAQGNWGQGDGAGGAHRHEDMGWGGHRELAVAQGGRGQGDRVGTGRHEQGDGAGTRMGIKGSGRLGAMGWAQQAAPGAGEGTPRSPAPSLCPQRRPWALEGPAQPQPGSGALRPHPGAASTRIQRRRHRRHLRVLHLPAQPFRCVGVRGCWGGITGPLRWCEGSALQRAVPPRTGTLGRPGSAWPCTCSAPVALSPSTSRRGPSTTAPSPGWSRWGCQDGGETGILGHRGTAGGRWGPWCDKDPTVTGAPGQGGVLKRGDGDPGVMGTWLGRDPRVMGTLGHEGMLGSTTGTLG